jgi:hypothetical protein
MHAKMSSVLRRRLSRLGVALLGTASSRASSSRLRVPVMLVPPACSPAAAAAARAGGQGGESKPAAVGADLETGDPGAPPIVEGPPAPWSSSCVGARPNELRRGHALQSREASEGTIHSKHGVPRARAVVAPAAPRRRAARGTGSRWQSHPAK